MESEKVKEIKKALECCLKPTVSYCVDCPYNNNGALDCDIDKMLKDALNLINEQENEIKRLRQEVRLNELKEYEK